MNAAPPDTPKSAATEPSPDAQPTPEVPPGGRLVVRAADTPRAVLVLGHGAGGSNGRDLDALDAALPALGIAVVRHVQPWVLEGRRIAPRPAALDSAWHLALPTVVELASGLPLVIGGRSAGARVAARVAAASGAAGVVALAFPLHPPGKPASSRVGELEGAGVPTLVVQGGRDAFGSADEVVAAASSVEGLRVVEIPTATHDFSAAKRTGLAPDEIARRIVDAVAPFVLELAAAQGAVASGAVAPGAASPGASSSGEPATDTKPAATQATKADPADSAYQDAVAGSSTRITSTPTSSVEVVFSP